MEAKGFSMAILGDSKVGKTTLCQSIVERPFNDKYEATNGCEYYQKIYEDSRNNQMMKIDIYCASGDKKSQKLAKYLYKDAVCIIIMFDLNDLNTFYNLRTYIENIRLNSVEDPIYYLVGNSYNGQSKVTDKMIQEFKKENDINDIKFQKLSCKDRKNVKDLLDDITKDVLLSEKYYTSTIDKDISDTSSLDDGTKEMEKLGKILKTFYKESKDKKPNFMRCKTCDRLLYIKFRNTYNEVSFICNYCNTENNVGLDAVERYIEQLSSKVICFECLKAKEEKTKLEYCNKCKHYVCPSCKKSIQKTLKQEGGEIHKLVPYYLMDILCFDHGKKILGYCKECQKGICIQCFEAHKSHENIFYENFVKKLINEHSVELNTEAANLNKIRENFEKCIKKITNEFNNFYRLKYKEIKLKEQLLNQLGSIKYNQQLIETIKNMKYMKMKNLPENCPWEKMLEAIFETIGQPIQIYNINISKKTNNITPNIVKIEEIKGSYNKNNNDNRIIRDEHNKNITDFCSMNDDQYIGISYNNGELEIYENKNPMRNAKNIGTYDIFINEKINSIHKSILNVNNYLFSGKGKILNVEFYNSYKKMKKILEIDDPKKNFQFALDQENFIVACDKNNIFLYDKEGNQIGDFTDIITRQGSKEIIKIDEVMNNIIYVNYVKSLDETSVSSVETQDPEDTNPDISMSREYQKKEQKLTGTKIIEFNEENNKIKRDHTLTDAQEIIGIVKNRLILIRDDEFSSVILFDAKSFKNVQRFYFEPEEKPIFGSYLGERGNLIGFLLISAQMKLIQNIYDAEHKSITQISGLKFQVKDDKIKENVVKEGKTILLPERGFIKFIGDNSFVFINYDL